VSARGFSIGHGRPVSRGSNPRASTSSVRGPVDRARWVCRARPHDPISVREIRLQASTDSHPPGKLPASYADSPMSRCCQGVPVLAESGSLRRADSKVRGCPYCVKAGASRLEDSRPTDERIWAQAEVRRLGSSLSHPRESSRRQNLLIRLQQDLFGRFSYHTNLLAGLGGRASEAIEEGRRRRVPFHGHIERTGVRIAPPSANLQRTGLIDPQADAAALRRACVSLGDVRFLDLSIFVQRGGLGRLQSSARPASVGRWAEPGERTPGRRDREVLVGLRAPENWPTRGAQLALGDLDHAATQQSCCAVVDRITP
jgi:hypothetical protein